MSLPRVEFTPWYPWKQRNRIKNSEAPGVYMLAKFMTVPSGSANPLNNNIIYFGETCRSLKGRWDQFDRSAFQSKSGHSGGINYRRIYGDIGQHLYLAGMPVTITDKTLRSCFIRFVERKLILDFVIKHDARPKCNLK